MTRIGSKRAKRCSGSRKDKMDIHFFAKTDVGKVREGNEDFFLNDKISENEYLFIIADGMGGHQAGDVASRLAAETFLDSYQLFRKKEHPIDESMELAIKKSNSAILKKAAADPSKRGMGTTFSAIVIAGMRAYIIHIGDSRIYLVKKNKIRRVTTDHTFVEKLVEDGRISPEEAREHPQKNVLYMSLGAREGFSPEILKEMQLEEGDAIVMCSDGLSNMVADELIKETVLSFYPEDAADELVRMANSNGGTDNITLQIIRIGSLEMLEKTKPLRMFKPRKKLITFFSLLGIIAIMIVSWFLFQPTRHNHVHDARETTRNAVRLSLPIQNAPIFLEASRIDENKLGEFRIAPSDSLFLAHRSLFITRGNFFYVFDWGKQSLERFGLDSDDTLVPSVLTGDIYLLRKSKTPVLEYKLFQFHEQKAPLMIIRSDNNFMSKDIKKRTIRIPNLSGRIVPLFLDDDLFIFSDLAQYYGIKKWKDLSDKESRFFPLMEAPYSKSSKLFFKKIAQDVLITYYRPEDKIIKVFSVKKDFTRVHQVQNFSMDVPLAIEYFADRSFLFFYSDRCVQFLGEDEKTLENIYPLDSDQIRISRVMIDVDTGQKVLITNENGMYTLTCRP